MFFLSVDHRRSITLLVLAFKSLLDGVTGANDPLFHGSECSLHHLMKIVTQVREAGMMYQAVTISVIRMILESYRLAEDVII